MSIFCINYNPFCFLNLIGPFLSFNMLKFVVKQCRLRLVLVQAESTSATNESVLKVALDHVKASGLIMPHDRVVVCQKVGDASVVKIIELED